jgi:hypothetical protein
MVVMGMMLMLLKLVRMVTIGTTAAGAVATPRTLHVVVVVVVVGTAGVVVAAPRGTARQRFRTLDVLLVKIAGGLREIIVIGLVRLARVAMR